MNQSVWFDDGKPCTDIWRKYRAGVEHHRSVNMYRRDERCWHFFNGDQWYGMSKGGQELPCENFIKPILKYKIATVATNDTTIVFSGYDEGSLELCRALDKFAEQVWEYTRMDAKKWKVVKAAAITGDSYVYTFDTRPESQAVVQDTTPRLEVQILDRSSVYLSDEQEPDIQKQGWIIVAERLPVAEVRRQARKNGLTDEEIELIVSDAETDTYVGQKSEREIKSGDGKCTSLVFFRLKEQEPELDEMGQPIPQEEPARRVLEFCRSTEGVIWQPMQDVPGMDMYPIAHMVWEEMPGDARGVGECEQLIPNQIEANKTLARRSLIVKRYGYPTAVYDRNRIANPQALSKVGSAIQATNLNGQPISSAIQYLEPKTTSGEGAALQAELIQTTRELEGASDNATGQVDVTKTSGEAIKAARDQAALTLNDQAAAYKDFIEQLARIWYKLWCAYSPMGLSFVYEDREGKQGMVNVSIKPEELSTMDVDLRIDVSPADPYSVASEQMSLDNALAQNLITFEEWVQVLDDNSPVPAAKFRKIIERRQQQINLQEQMQKQAAAEAGALGAGGLLNQMQIEGGTSNAVPTMPM